MPLPSVSYAFMLWAHDTSLQKTNRCLTALDRLALKFITHSAQSCPTRGLAVILNLYPYCSTFGVLLYTLLSDTLTSSDLTGLATTTRRDTLPHTVYTGRLPFASLMSLPLRTTPVRLTHFQRTELSMIASLDQPNFINLVSLMSTLTAPVFACARGLAT